MCTSLVDGSVEIWVRSRMLSSRWWMLTLGGEEAANATFRFFEFSEWFSWFLIKLPRVKKSNKLILRNSSEGYFRSKTRYLRTSRHGIGRISANFPFLIDVQTVTIHIKKLQQNPMPGIILPTAIVQRLHVKHPPGKVYPSPLSRPNPIETHSDSSPSRRSDRTWDSELSFQMFSTSYEFLYLGWKGILCWSRSRGRNRNFCKRSRRLWLRRRQWIDIFKR